MQASQGRPGNIAPPRTLRRAADPALAASVIEHLSVPTFALAVDRRVLLWNKACERLTGVAAESVLGTRRHWRAFYNRRRPCLAELVLTGRNQDVPSFYDRHAAPASSAHGVAVEGWSQMPRLGQPLYLAIEAAPIYDSSGAIVAAVETLRDLTTEKRRQLELESLAALDGLTGLLNRRSFDERLRQEIRRVARERLPLALLMVDVDDFKPYNDAHGHQVGDEGLRRVALAIRSALSRAGDLAARYGGDEFAVILPGVDRNGALHVAERIRERVDALGIANPFSAATQCLTLSIGGCVAPNDFSGAAEDLVARADAELYRAKWAGRNRTSVAEFEIIPKAVEAACSQPRVVA